MASPLGSIGLISRHLDAVRGPLIPVLLAGCLMGAACAQQAPVDADVRVEWSVRPTLPVVGTTAVGEIALRDAERRLVRGATLRVDAHMSHPGMTPVAAMVEERADGTHEVHLAFTMAGDWVLHVTGALPDGRRLDRWLNVTGVRSAE